jgi:hypothetical protein
MKTTFENHVTQDNMYRCTCIFSCADDPMTACGWSGVEWHVHPKSQGIGFGPCPVHPDAPGDL